MKMNAKVFKEWAEKYQMIESGNYVQFWDGNTEMSSWFDKTTYKFAPADKYEELEAISEKHALELTKAKYEGKTNMEKIAAAEANYSEHDKAVIANAKNRLYL